MCLANDAHIRVATLKNHILQNNDFTRFFYTEQHLHPKHRMELGKRGIRLLTYLSLFLALTSHIATMGQNDIGVRGFGRRAQCRRSCELIHFPTNSCTDIENVTIKILENKYTEFFNFDAPAIGIDEERLAEYQNCVYHALDPDDEGQNKLQWWTETHRERSDVCFTKCRRRNEKYIKLAHDIRQPCEPAMTQYQYDQQFRRDKNLNKYHYEGLNKDWLECDVSKEECDLFYNQGMYCVTEEDGFDNGTLRDFAYTTCHNFSTDSVKNSWCINFFDVLIVILVGDFIYFIIDFVMYLSTKYNEESINFEEGVKRFSCQVFITICFALIVISTMGGFAKAYRAEKQLSVWVTVIIAILIDQFKSVFIVQPLVWWAVIRRCGHLILGLQEYNFSYIGQWELEESLMEIIRIWMADFLKRPWIKIWLTHISVGAYSFFVMLQLALADQINELKILVLIIITIDLIFICFFFLEVALKIFAYGPLHYRDPWNLFDLIVIIGSLLFWLYVHDQVGGPRGFALLRLLKLVRMMIVVRRCSEGRKKLKALQKENETGYDVGTQVDKMLELVDELQLLHCIPQFLKEDLEWFTEIVVDNKLYKVSIEEKSGDDSAAQTLSWLDDGANTVLGTALVTLSKVTSSKVQGTSVRMSKIKGSRAGGEGGSGDTKEERIAALYQNIYSKANLSKADEGQIDSQMGAVDTWGVDVLALSEMLDVFFIPFLFLNFVHANNFVQIINIDQDYIFNFCQKTQTNSRSTVKFHNPVHVGLMMQACHFFFMHGLEIHVAPVEKFVLFFACIVCYDSHPGLTNDFLVNARHPRATRYNDNAILQNYNLANVFNMLSDPENNFFVHTPKQKFDEFRKKLINIVLRSDMRKHFDEISMFKTKLASDFPLPNNEEDNLVLLAISLRLADLSWTCRPLNNYLRWVERFQDEMSNQGELEKQMGLPVSPFCDTDTRHAEKSQLAYLVAIVHPLATSYNLFLNNAKFHKDVLVDGLDSNRMYYKKWVQK